MREDLALISNLSIITVFHNHVSFVDGYFRSFQRVYGSLPCELIIIDNDSNDGTQARLEWWQKKKGFSFQYYPLKENLGFGAAHNNFISKTNTSNLLFLNPDVSFVYDFFSPCLKALNTHQGLISPLFKDLSGMYYSSSSPFYEDEWFSVKKLLYMLYPYQNIQCVDWIQGACLFLRRDQFLAVQGFRKEYFVYTEDMALARDFNDHGWQSRILKDHWVYHPRRALNGDKFKRICTNLVHYFQGKDPGPYHRHLKLKAMAGQIPFEWLLHFEKTLKLRL